MKKLKEIFLILLFFIVLLFIITICTFSNPFYCYDEIWNFQSINKMHQNSLIYRDHNVIITPLFFHLGNLMFYLFGANLAVFRIYNVGIYFIKYLVLFFIFRHFKTKKSLAALYTSIWICLDFSNITCGANYNQLATIFCLFGVLLYFSNTKKNSYHFLQGFLIFLTFFTKQTIGIYYAFGIVLFELIHSGFGKNFWKNQLLKLSTFLPCLVVSCIIMSKKGNLIDCINLCFGGIFEFGSNHFSISWNVLKELISISFIIAFSLFCIMHQKVPTTVQKNTKFLLCVSLGNSFNLFPLANPYHINLALLFYYLLFMYLMDQLLISEVFTSKKHKIVSILICTFIFLAHFIKVAHIYYTNQQDLTHFDKTHPFYNVAIASKDSERIQTITAYIKEKQKNGIQVIVLSYEAASFMVPLNLNNHEFDLPFSGNLGYHGIEKTISKISHMKNTEFLIFTNENDCFIQESKEIRNYILNHLQKIDEILEYSIYINQ